MMTNIMTPPSNKNSLKKKYKINLFTVLTYLINRDQYPGEECFVRERSSLGELLVQLRVGESDLASHGLVKDQGEDWQHCTHCSITHHQEVLVQRHRGEVKHGKENNLGTSK